MLDDHNPAGIPFSQPPWRVVTPGVFYGHDLGLMAVLFPIAIYSSDDRREVRLE
jgi:hypothetical protein